MSSQNVCVQSRRVLVPSTSASAVSASGSAICQSTSLSMSPSNRSSRMLRGVASSSSSEYCCTLRLFCVCDGTGTGRTGMGGHSPGRDSFRRWMSICIFTLRKQNGGASESAHGLQAWRAWIVSHSRFSIPDSQRFLSSMELCMAPLGCSGHGAWRSHTKSIIDASRSVQEACEMTTFDSFS